MHYSILSLFSLLLFLGFGGLATGQIVTTDPPFPKPNEPVTITFDASQGNAQLAGLPPGTPVYAHTGLITENGGPGSWQYIVGNWATDDARVRMNRIGTSDRYQITLAPSLSEWYESNNNANASIPDDETIVQMAFVFRNQNGSLEGKTAEGGDIFVEVFPPDAGLIAQFTAPQGNLIAALNDTISVTATSSIEAAIRLFDNGLLIAQDSGESLQHAIAVLEDGDHEVVVEAAADGATARDTFYYSIPPAVNVIDPPAGTELGATYLTDSTVRLMLMAPGKEEVYLLGDFNNWAPRAAYFMNRSIDDSLFWLDLPVLEPGRNYAYQYWVDGELRVADPFSELILDPANDGFIPEANFPDLPPYPAGKTSGIVSLLQPGKPAFDWQVTDFEKPAKEDLVVYELHMRDFIAAQNYQTLLDTLDYLDRLGINAIEFMPVSEFRANLSWGYDPTFHMALDKYYGTPDAFKAVVDACHARGMAVILDVVYNHVHELSPLAQLYWDPVAFQPRPDNPWLNQQPTHDFNVFFDVNHESPATRAWLDRVVTYWLEEYRVDGYRMDLSKGFTQNVGGSFDAFAYDASRIAILKRMADVIWAADPEAYVILEHFAANEEEKELAEYGMMTWGKMTDPYNQFTMGYNNSDLGGISYQNRGWDVPHLVGYMESHDEERLMYKNLEFGNSNGDGSYDIRDLGTALQRMELAANFFFPVPGPKMIWQFGELGYDVTIFWCDGQIIPGDDLCKLAPKPIRWNYQQDVRRQRVYETFRNLIELRETYPVFQTDDFELDVDQSAWKRIRLNHPDMNVCIIGNANVATSQLDPNFQHTGWWYEYYSGDSILVADVNARLEMAPGEYRLYTDVYIGEARLPTSVHTQPGSLYEASVFPNPVSAGQLNLELNLRRGSQAEVRLLNLSGQWMAELYSGYLPEGYSITTLNGNADLPTGIYLLQVVLEDGLWTQRIVVP